MATIEYRKLFRANVCLKVNYSIANAPQSGGTTFSRNLSSTGLSVIIPEPLKEGDELKLDIFLPEEYKPVTAKGRIIWQRLCTYTPGSKKRYYSTGISFQEMAAEDVIKTSDFIGNILRKQREDEDRTIIEKIEDLKK